jgi:hypothetical protein
MATSPSYAATPVAWSGLVGATADTSYTAPTHGVTLGTAGTSGTKITEINIIPVGTVIAGIVNIFLYNGTTYYLWESVTIAAATINTTSAPTKQTYTYDNLVLPSNSWTMVVTNTVVSNESLVLVNAVGASL